MADSLSGAKGEVTIGAGEDVLVNVFEWEADVQRDIFDDSHFDGDVHGGKTKVGGMAKLNGRCTGFARAGVTTKLATIQTPGAATGAAFVLETDNATGDGYSFTGKVFNVTPTVNKVNLIGVTFNFESLGLVIPIA